MTDTANLIWEALFLPRRRLALPFCAIRKNMESDFLAADHR